MFLATSARADEVTDNLKTGLSAYEAANYSEALQAVDYASTLIRQKKVAALLPAAPSSSTAVFWANA